MSNSFETQVPGPPVLVNYDPRVDVPETDGLVEREEGAAVPERGGQSESQQVPVIVRTYASRWYILCVFSLLGLYQVIIMFTFDLGMDKNVLKPKIRPEVWQTYILTIVSHQYLVFNLLFIIIICICLLYTSPSPRDS